MIIRPLSLLLLLMIAVPFEITFIPFLPLQLSIALFIALCSALFLWIRPARSRVTGLESWLLCYCIFAIVSVFYADLTIDDNIFSALPAEYGIRGSRYRGLYQLLFLLLSYLVALVVVNGCRNLMNLRRILDIFFKIALFVNAFAVCELFAKTFGLPFAYPRFENWDYVSNATIGGFSRIYSVFEEPGTYGRFLSIVIVLSTVIYTNSTKSLEFHRYPLKLTLATSLLCLILTFSISGIVVLLLMIGLYLLRLRTFSRGNTIALRIMLLFLVLFSITLTLLGANIFLVDKLQGMMNVNVEESATSETVRSYGMLLGLKAVLEHPLLGVGFGNELFFTYMPEISNLTFGSHNMLITLLVEGGALGTLFYGWLFWRIFKKNITLNCCGEWDEGRIIMIGLKYSLGTSLLHHFVFGAARLTSMDWLLIGLIIAVPRLSNSPAKFLNRDFQTSVNGISSHARA